MIPEFRLFGGATLIASNGELASGAAAQPRRVAVLAVLADAWPSAVTRDRIVGLIWPDNDDAGARRLLTQALYALRRELGEFTRASGRDLALDADALRVDLVEFRRALSAGDQERAAALYRGPLLDGFYLKDADGFERWAESLRDSTRRQLQGVVEEIAGRYAAEGKLREAACWGERMVQAAPFDANAALYLMELWERAGDRGAAFMTATAYERRMLEDLGLEPDPAVLRRVEEMRALLPPTPTAVGGSRTQLQTDLSTAARAAAAPPPDRAPMDFATEVSTEVVTEIASQVTSDFAVASEPPPSATVTTRRSARRLGLMQHPLTYVSTVLAAAAWLIGTAATHRKAEPPSARTVKAIAFQVRGDSSAMPSLGSMLTTMLVANLDGSAGTRVEETADEPDSDPEPHDAWAILSGEVIVTGELIRLDGELRSLSGGSPPRRITVAGPRDSLVGLVDQLSLRLVPAFYPELERQLDEQSLRSFHQVETLRHYLDGEVALRRGAYEEAYQSFRAVTERDSSLAYAWYRRAVAAEQVHRNEDADRSIAAAEGSWAALSRRKRQLLRAYATWRLGDVAGAEPVFRHLVETVSSDREAWFQFGELAYHGWPLRGRPLDAAQDVWRQVVALDSSNYPALMHAIRLEARARDTVAVAALLHRAAEVAADGPGWAESRIIAAYGVGTPAEVAAVQGDLDALPAYSLDFLEAAIAGLLEQPAAAEDIARRLIEPSRPDAVQAEGRIALAHLAFARGRWREAWAELDRAAKLNPAAVAWSRAYLASLPFFPAPDSILDHAARELDAAAGTAGAAPLYLQLAVEAPAAPVIQSYLMEELRLAGASNLAGGSPPSALGGAGPNKPACDPESSTITRELCLDLRAGLAAESARRSGDYVGALRSLESLGMRVPYQYAARSVFFARTRERFLRGALLERASRLTEAYEWYAAVPHGARLDYVYLAPTHLHRGQILERQGDRAGAAVHYRRVLELWRKPDPELVTLRSEAEDGLRRVSPAPRATS